MSWKLQCCRLLLKVVGKGVVHRHSASGTMHAYRFGMNFEETIVGKLTEVYQTVHLKEFADFPKKDEKDPTGVFTDIHWHDFEKLKKSVAHEAYHLSHGFYH